MSCDSYSGDSSASGSPLTEPRRSRICSVCEEQSQSYHLNYGAPSCLSCRAFFRRTVQGQKTSSLVCKFETKPCVVNLKTRGKCKKCRYDKCIQKGMKPEAVLNGEQIQVRFRKVIKKKKKWKKFHTLVKKPLCEDNSTRTRTTKDQEKLVKTETSKPHFSELECSVMDILMKRRGFQNDKSKSDSSNSMLSDKNGLGYSSTQNIDLATKKQVDSFLEEIDMDYLLELNDLDLSKILQDDQFSEINSKLQLPSANLLNVSINMETNLDLNPILQADKLSQINGKKMHTRTANLFNVSINMQTDLDLNTILQADRSIQSNSETKIQPGVNMSNASVQEQIFISNYDKQCEAGELVSIIPHSDQDNSSFVKTNMPSYSSATRNPSSNFEYMSYINCVRQKWLEAVSQFEPADEFVHSLINLHNKCGEATNPILKAMLKEHLEQFVFNIVKAFAFSHAELMTNLSIKEQQLLIQRGSSLFGHYLFGRYISAPSGYEQLNWLLLGKVPEFVQLIPDLQRVSLSAFDVKLNETSIGNYERYANMLVCPQMGWHYNSVIALICLLCNSSNSVGKRRLEYVYRVCDFAEREFKCPGSKELAYTLEVLQKMNEFSVPGNGFTKSPIFSEMTTPFDQSDTAFCLDRYELIQAAHNQVPYMEKSLLAFFLHSMDIPVPRDFFSGIAKVWSERYRYILKAHCEFTALSEQDQATIWHKNSFRVLALVNSAQEQRQNGTEQIRYSHGQLDNSTLEQIMQSVGLSRSNFQFKKFSLADNTSSIQDKETREKYKCVVKRIQNSVLLAQDEIINLLRYISMFSKLDQWKQLSHLEKQYQHLLFRKLAHDNGYKRGRELFEQCMNGLQDIDDLATILEKLSLCG